MRELHSANDRHLIAVRARSQLLDDAADPAADKRPEARTSSAIQLDAQIRNTLTSARHLVVCVSITGQVVFGMQLHHVGWARDDSSNNLAEVLCDPELSTVAVVALELGPCDASRLARGMLCDVATDCEISIFAPTSHMTMMFDRHMVMQTTQASRRAEMSDEQSVYAHVVTGFEAAVLAQAEIRGLRATLQQFPNSAPTFRATFSSDVYAKLQDALELAFRQHSRSDIAAIGFNRHRQLVTRHGQSSAAYL